MRRGRGSIIRRCALVVGGLLGSLALTGCSGTDSPETAEDPGVAVDEVSQHDGQVCPERLPTRSDGNALGSDDLASELPNPGDFAEGWMCTYQLAYRGGWSLDRNAVQLSASELVGLADAIDDLEVSDTSGRVCTANLGPRHMAVTVREGKDLTGYVVDDFGCRDTVRVTDEPFETVAGDAQQTGTVKGTLNGGNSLVKLADATSN